MLRLIQWFFVSLGVVTFVLVCLLGFVWVSDYGGVRSTTTGLYQLYENPPNLSQLNRTPFAPGAESEDASLSNTTEPTLSRDDGVETPEGSPNTTTDRNELSFTEAEIACFREKLGSERVDEIYASGEEPTPSELLLGMTCL